MAETLSVSRRAPDLNSKDFMPHAERFLAEHRGERHELRIETTLSC
jgi:hypothetical protein